MPDNSLLQALLARAQTPLTEIPTQAAQAVARPVTDYGMNHAGPLGTAAKYAGAFGENVGDTLTGMTSPLQLALAAATGGLGKGIGRLAGAGVGLTSKAAVGAAKALPGAVPGLTHATAEFAPVGGEAAANAARAGMQQVASPGARNVEQTLYRRIMDSGAGNVGRLGSEAGKISVGDLIMPTIGIGAGGYAAKKLYDTVQNLKSKTGTIQQANPFNRVSGVLDGIK